MVSTLPLLRSPGFVDAPRPVDPGTRAAAADTPRAGSRSPALKGHAVTRIAAITRRRFADDGASAVEYGLLVATIAAVIALVVIAVGGYVRGNYQTTCDNISATGAQNLSTSTC